MVMIIGLTCLKKNSTRLPGKHHMKFNNSTLFKHSLEEILATSCLERIYICTDDERIWASNNINDILIIKEPEMLAKSNSTWKVINWMIKKERLSQKDVLIYLPCTAPLRKAEDIEEAYKLFKSKSCNSVVSVKRVEDPPEWSFPIKLNRLIVDGLKMTSQELKPYYCLNGSIYISTVKNLIRYNGYFGGFVLPYIMPYERSVNIDSLSDFQKAEKYYKEVMIKNE